ncbi:hypothetical protein ACFY8Q_31565 [[Kitasatospora] papulosa]|uniref:hypothetical protein n=1 Tax=[Kitasatospora] papulosa TaxID=1464011 RepID=UPI0036BE41FA
MAEPVQGAAGQVALDADAQAAEERQVLLLQCDRGARGIFLVGVDPQTDPSGIRALCHFYEEAPLPGCLEREAVRQLEGLGCTAAKQQQNMTVIRRDLPPSIDGGSGGLDA